VCLILQGSDAILVDNAENLLSADKKVVEDIQVATIEIKDHSVRERLGLKWVKRDVHTVKKFGPVFKLFPKKKCSYVAISFYVCQ
jgi:hypothetical protein